MLILRLWSMICEELEGTENVIQRGGHQSASKNEVLFRDLQTKEGALKDPKPLDILISML